uniref:Putative secreted protein n=1 Tax=Ixodes ricinus TaxID=34613 RepID=V5HCZ6_IXORI
MMRALTIVLISVLLLECLYLAECQGRHRNRDTDRRPPPCSQVCKISKRLRAPVSKVCWWILDVIPVQRINAYAHISSHK